MVVNKTLGEMSRAYTGGGPAHGTMANYTHISLDVVCDLDDWEVVDVKLSGVLTSDKCVLVRPDDGRYFVYKSALEKRERSIWSELTASFIAGDLLGWDVQHVSLGIRNGRPGNLLKFFYEPDQNEAFFEGAWFLGRTALNAMVEKRKLTNTLPAVLQAYEYLIGPYFKLDREAFMDFWARMLAFDALISNTDRSSTNWGIVTSPSGPRMTALYDHDRGFGVRMSEKRLRHFFKWNGAIDTARLEGWAQNIRHIVGTNDTEMEGAHFVPLCREFLALYPEGRAAFEQAQAIDQARVRDLLELVRGSIDLPPGRWLLTEKKIVHMCAVLNLGISRICEILQK